MKYFYRILILSLILGMAACVAGKSDNISSNDEDEDIGIGGTGLVASVDNGLGGTGIVGNISGFGSIFVNGIEIEYDHTTPFFINGETRKYQTLAIGDVVEVLTSDNKQRTNARLINLRHELVGIVDSVNADTINIQGQTVLLPDDNNEIPNIGDKVAISGFRIDVQSIQATRISSAKSMNAFIRTQNDLPFENQTTHWLMQTHVENNSVNVWLDGSMHNLSAPAASTDHEVSKADIRVLQIHKTKDSVLIKQVLDPSKLPQGSATQSPSVMPVNNMSPGQIYRNNPPRMHHGGK